MDLGRTITVPNLGTSFLNLICHFLIFFNVGNFSIKYNEEKESIPIISLSDNFLTSYSLKTKVL